MSILDWIVSKMAFFPRQTEVVPTLVVDVDGARLGCHVRKPFPDAGMVVYFHGNGELASECDQWLAPLFLEARRQYLLRRVSGLRNIERPAGFVGDAR